MENKERIAKNKHILEQRRRKLKRIRLILSLVALLLLAIVVTSIASTAKKHDQKASSESAAQLEKSEEAAAETADESSEGSLPDGNENNGVIVSRPEAVSPEPTPETTPQPPVTITISAAGDCTLGTDENFDYDTCFDAKFQEEGYYEYFFENVQDEFASDDLTIVNLEGTFTYSDYREDKTYAFKGSPDYVNILKAGSIEACNFANNHSHDYGSDSYTDTISYVEEAGITIFGYDRSQVMDVKGIKVGLVGVYELASDYGCEEDLLRELDAVKSQGAQIIIVSFHWGDEGEHFPTDIQTYLGHSAIDHGADLVLGHHPHVLQGIETYNGKNIVYSMGNFCFGGNKNPSDKGSMIYKQTFTIENGQLSDDNDYRIVPCCLSSTWDYNNYQPTILYGDDAQALLDRINSYSEGIYG